MKFLTKANFAEKVELAVMRNKMTYIEAVVFVCDENDIEPEDSKKFISNIIRDKIEAEARSLNCLPRRATLPV